MTWQTERSAIETYLQTEWAGATAIIMDAHTGTPAVNTISVTINSGLVRQGSIGRASNRIEYIGILQILIYTEPGKGSAAWRGYAETLKGIFFNKRITSAGVGIATVDEEFIRFSPGEQHPYIAGSDMQAGMMTTTLNVPFIRYETE